MNFVRYLKYNIKKRRYIFWSFFHPDNLLKFKYANKAEEMAWEFVIKKKSDYKSICEIGCFNGKILFFMPNSYDNYNFTA